jgi:hypothetical protein
VAERPAVRNRRRHAKEAEFPDEAAVWIALRGDPNQQGSSYFTTPSRE